MATRDEFPQKVIRTVALRAGYLCSNLECRHPTAGPHSDPEKAIVTGEAAHIRAASENGPRYDPDQSPEQRKSIQNAIWLCGNCNKKVDTDWAAWPAERLIETKSAHEGWIAAEAMIPSLPEISLTTRTGLRLHENVPEVTAPIQEALREQQLVIRNPNRVDLFNFELFLNLPETIDRPGHHEIPVGIDARMRPVQPANQAFLRGNAKITRGQPVPTQHFKIDINKLGANASIDVAFYTVKPEQTMPYEFCKMTSGFPDPELMDEHKTCYFFLEGTYQFILRNEYVIGNMFVPLFFKAKERTIKSQPVQDTVEPWSTWRGFLAAGATMQVGGSRREPPATTSPA